MNKYERIYNICAGLVFLTISLLLVFFMVSQKPWEEKTSNSEIVYEESVDLWTGAMGTIRMVEAWAIEETAEGWLLEDREGNQWIVEGLSTAVEEEEWVLLWIADMDTTDSINDDVVIKVWMSA